MHGRGHSQVLVTLNSDRKKKREKNPEEYIPIGYRLGLSNETQSHYSLCKVSEGLCYVDLVLYVTNDF